MLLLTSWQPNKTSARAPMVRVTAGPTVVRSTNDDDVVVWEVVTVPKSGVRAAPTLAPVEQKMDPAAVNFAGAVSAKLSRMI